MQKQAYRRLALLKTLVFLTFTVSVVLADGRIDTRWDQFSLEQTRSPEYTKGITYTALLSDPHPDAVFSYAMDNWAFTADFLDYFKHIKTALNIRYVQFVVAMADGTYIVGLFDLDEVVFHKGYYPQVDDRLIITQEFLAEIIPYMELHSEQEIWDHIDAQYDLEWIAHYRGLKLPHFLVTIAGGGLLATILALRRRGK